MRLGGKGMWGRGPALCKQNYLKKKKKKNIFYILLCYRGGEKIKNLNKFGEVAGQLLTLILGEICEQKVKCGISHTGRTYFYSTRGFWPRVGARALRALIF